MEGDLELDLGRQIFELDWALQRHNRLLDAFVPFTFVGNHDVTRIATAIADLRHHGHATALLLTLGGTPSIYYGDELGLTGRKEERVGGGSLTLALNSGDAPLDLDAADTLLAGAAEGLGGARWRVPGHGWAVLG